jgi:hypothetical protein
MEEMFDEVNADLFAFLTTDATELVLIDTVYPQISSSDGTVRVIGLPIRDTFIRCL